MSPLAVFFLPPSLPIRLLLSQAVCPALPAVITAVFAIPVPVVRTSNRRRSFPRLSPPPLLVLIPPVIFPGTLLHPPPFLPCRLTSDHFGAAGFVSLFSP